MRRAALILTMSLMLVAPSGARPQALPAPTPDTGPMPARPEPTYRAGECRLTCAQTYYFCLASDAPDNCPAAWSQCRAACDTPTPTTP